MGNPWRLWCTFSCFKLHFLNQKESFESPPPPKGVHPGVREGEPAVPVHLPRGAGRRTHRVRLLPEVRHVPAEGGRHQDGLRPPMPAATGWWSMWECPN